MRNPLFLFRCMGILLTAAALVLHSDEGAFAGPGTASNSMNILKKAVLEFNASEYAETSGRSYRGGEGCLLLDPLTARSLGLRSLVTEDYTRGRTMLEEAEKTLSLGLDAMNSAGSGDVSEEMLRLIHDYSCSYNQAVTRAEEHMQAYRKAVTRDKDERMEQGSCEALLERLLDECLEKTGGNLRDSLGCLYNRTRGLEEGVSAHLNTRNILFVNKVFASYAESVDKGVVVSVLDLDRQGETGDIVGRWDRARSAIKNPFISILDQVFRKNLKAGLLVDPLLFLGLMRQESNFNPSAVSHVGAAGLTQIMPSTGKSLGMKNIYMPSYYEEARDFLARETESRREGVSLFKKACGPGWRDTALQALKKIRQSNQSKAKRVELYGRYKAELLSGAADDRLDPEKAISHGFAYFGGILRAQGGDMSLALAGYNSGPHRVSQYEGLPPFAETIGFRNNVLRFYREYLAAAGR